MQVELVREWRVRDSIYCLTSISEENFVAAGAEGIIFLIKPGQATKSISLLRQVDNTIYCTSFINSWLGAGGRGGNLHAFNLANEGDERHYNLTEDIYSLVALDEDNYVAGCGTGIIVAMGRGADDAILMEKIHPAQGNTRCLIAHNDMSFLAGFSDGTMRGLSQTAGGIQQTFSVDADKNSVFSIVVDRHIIVSGGRDAQLKFWTNTNSPELLSMSPAHIMTINTIVSLEKAGMRGYFATGSRDKTIKVWKSNADVWTLEKVMDLSKYPDAHKHSVNALLPLPGGYLVSGGDDNSIKLWKLAIDN